MPLARLARRPRVARVESAVMHTHPPQSPAEWTNNAPGPDSGSIPLPSSVQPLVYAQGQAGGAEAWRLAARGVGLVAALVGGLLVLTNGLQLVGWIGGWSDPYMFKMNQPGGVGGLPPSPWLAAVSVG